MLFIQVSCRLFEHELKHKLNFRIHLLPLVCSMYSESKWLLSLAFIVADICIYIYIYIYIYILYILWILYMYYIYYIYNTYIMHI